MITLECDKCGKKIEWYLSESAPSKWIRTSDWLICDICVPDYLKFEDKLCDRKKRELEKYFDKA